MHPPPTHIQLRRRGLAPLALLALVVIGDCWQAARAQISSYSNSETRIDNAPLQVQATFDNTSKISIITSGIVGLRSPWAGTAADMKTHGGPSHNFYNAAGAISGNLANTNGDCLNATSFSTDCAATMPLLRYEAGTATLADYYAVANSSASFNLSISTVNPDQPSSLTVIRPQEGTVLIPNTQAGASRYQVTVPGGTGMVITKDDQGGLTLDASRATAGSSGQLSMISVTTSPDHTAISQSTADVRLDAPTALAEANRVNFIRAAGTNVNVIGRGCGVDSAGKPSGSGCTVGIVAATERFQVWDPVKAQPVQLIRPRLIDADYLKADPNQRTANASVLSLRADTNQTFATTCHPTTGVCHYVVETNEDKSGLKHSTVVPINEVPLANDALTTILLPSYSTQIFNAGGIAGEGLGAVMRTAEGAGNTIRNNGTGTTTTLQTTSTVIMNQ